MYNLGNYIFTGIFTQFSLFEVKIQAFKSQMFKTKLSKNPGKNIISQIIHKVVACII